MTQVLTDVTGVTGLAILRAIVAGERDPVKLARLRNPACKSSEDEIAKALTGTWQPEHVFALQQSLELYDFYTQKVAECDTAIEQHFAALRPRWVTTNEPGLPRTKRGSKSKNRPALNVRAHLYHLTGVDLVAVEGISESIAQTLLSEIGTDMSKWPSEKHFASWLGLAPHNDISGGRVLRSRTLPTANRAGQALRMAAQSVARSDSAFGAFYRRMKSRAGPEQAITATAHRIARTVYFLLKHRAAYCDIGAEAYNQRQGEKTIASLKRQAAKLGFMLTPHLAEPAPAGG